jgi:hypothetical protein
MGIRPAYPFVLGLEFEMLTFCLYTGALDKALEEVFGQKTTPNHDRNQAIL